ncbi:MAG: hypothetical protein ACJAUA_000631 [Zhongshania aliphaticivorans]|jgi:uncharacterized protein (TIGR02597 family)
MKSLKYIKIQALSLLFVSFSLSAQTVSTDPVGYVTLDIAANGFTFVGTPLVNEIAFAGVAVAASTNSVSFTANAFETGEFNQITIGSENSTQYIFEVTSGSDIGAMIPIVSNTTNALMLSEDVSGFVTAGTTGIVRALHTLDSLFPSGVPLNAGFSAAVADEVLVFDAVSQTSKNYFYSSLAGEWRSGSISSGRFSLLPNQSLYIKRKGSATSVTFAGSVKMGTTAIDIFPGLNLIPNLYPVAYSLDLSGLYTADSSTGLAAGFSAAVADEVVFINADASSTTYFYSSLANEWRTGSTPAGDLEIPVGGAILIKRKAPLGAFSWVKTQPF